MRSVRALLVLSLMSIIGFVFVISMFITPAPPRIYQQSVVNLNPKCEVVKKGNRFEVTFSWNPNGSRSYVLYIFKPVNYKGVTYDPTIAPGRFNYELINGRAVWKVLLNQNPYWQRGRIEGYIKGKRNGMASFVCTPSQSSDNEKLPSLPTPTKRPVPVNHPNNNSPTNNVGGNENPVDTFPSSNQRRVKVGDLNNNGIAFDRGDVVCAILKYLQNKGNPYRFPDPNRVYVYNVNSSGSQFDRSDVIKMIINYLNNPQQRGGGRCLPLDASVNKEGERITNVSKTLRGVGYCHWYPGPHDKVVWFYQTSIPSVWWSELNPADGVYNIRPLIDYIKRVDKELPSGSKVLIELYLAGVARDGRLKYPKWVVDKGAVYVPRREDGTFVPWDPVFKQELSKFLQAVNNAFEDAWGQNLENKPKSFEGIVVWSGGYYGEMQIWWPTNRSLWERYGSEKLGISPSHPSFKQKFNELWTRSAIELASMYAETLHPKIRLMFQMGNGLYANIFNWQGQYFQSETATTDLAAAMEIVHRFPYRFYFKFNGWVTGMPPRKQWEMYYIKQTGKALGVGYEVGHGVTNARWMVDYVLGVNDTNGNQDGYQGPVGIPRFKVDYVCIQPTFVNKFGNELKRLATALNP